MKKQLVHKINLVLKDFIHEKIKEYAVNKTSPVLAKYIREFVLRDGKRIRPLFFLLAYSGYSKNNKLNKNAVRASLAFELLHDFLLIHDDIIDNSQTRRGKPTLHRVFQSALKLQSKTGQDISIIAGDIIFALAVTALFDNNLPEKNRRLASSIFLKSVVLTGIGEVKDVLNGLARLDKISVNDILLNYRLKTAEYTFKAPLACGCILAGAGSKEAEKIAHYGQLLGEAFQIQDDLIGIFGDSKQIGKSVLSDIIESKITLPIYQAYNNCAQKEKNVIVKSMGNKNLRYAGLQKIRKIVLKSGAYSQTKKKISRLLQQAEISLNKLKLSSRNKQLLKECSLSFIKP